MCQEISSNSEASLQISKVPSPSPPFTPLSRQKKKKKTYFKLQEKYEAIFEAE